MPFLAGILMLAVSTFMTWFGKSIVWHIISRVLQGSATSVVWIAGLAMLIDTVPPEQVGQYMGYIGIGLMTGG